MLISCWLSVILFKSVLVFDNSGFVPDTRRRGYREAGCRVQGQEYSRVCWTLGAPPSIKQLLHIHHFHQP